MKQRTKRIIEALETLYQGAKSMLDFKNNYELLVAVILSAQCTDKRVNAVTKKLFEKYDTPQKMIKLSHAELQKIIFTCGLYKRKAEYILSASCDIILKHGGNVPDTLNGLTALKGVGRKTANVVYSVGFKKNAIAVDTHVLRVSNRLGLADTKNPKKCEEALMREINEDYWNAMHHYLIYHGRNICKSRKPLCNQCALIEICAYRGKNV